MPHITIDLTVISFCVPLIDKFSPLAYVLVNEVHWYHDDARHSGNETVMRYVQQIAHLIDDRSLVQQFRRQCPRCRSIEVAMGSVSPVNLCIAPAFYVCQVDMFVPYGSFSHVNKRATPKVCDILLLYNRGY